MLCYNLQRRWEVAVQSLNLRNSGKAFQTKGLATQNAISQNMVLVLDTTHWISQKGNIHLLKFYRGKNRNFATTFDISRL